MALSSPRKRGPRRATVMLEETFIHRSANLYEVPAFAGMTVLFIGVVLVIWWVTSYPPYASHAKRNQSRRTSLCSIAIYRSWPRLASRPVPGLTFS